MNLRLLLLLGILSIKMVASDPSIVIGYGASQLNSPDSDTSSGVTTYSLGLSQDFSSNETESVRLSGLFNTNRDENLTLLSEIELQVALKKKVTPRQSVAVGFQVAIPLTSSFDDYEIKGSGFGVNIGYSLQVIDSISWNIVGKSTAYTLDIHSSETFDRLTNQTITTYVSIGVD